MWLACQGLAGARVHPLQDSAAAPIAGLDGWEGREHNAVL